MKKKILHVTKYYYPFLGGTENVSKYIAEGLNKKYDNIVICFNHIKSKKDCSIDYVNGIKVYRVSCFAKIASQSISFYFKKILKRIIDDWSPDAIHFHLPNPFVGFILLQLLPNDCKLILHWHLDITKQKIIYRFIKNNELKLIKRSDEIWTTSPNYKLDSKPLSNVQDKVRVIPNGINTSIFKLLDSDYKNIEKIRLKYNNKPLIFFVGRHVPYKGLEYLIEAEKIVKNDCHFVIAGNGELTLKLKEKSNPERISFIGKISDNELRQYLYASSIFAFPSITKNEAFGVALAESMYCGLSAVTFHIAGSGVNWVSLNNKTCLEVENRNSLEYAKAIDKLLSNKDMLRNMGINSRRRATENFTQEKVLEMILKDYSNLL